MNRIIYNTYTRYICHYFIECAVTKPFDHTTRNFIMNLFRLRHIEFERYLTQNFKHKFNEKKTKNVRNIGRFLLGAAVISFSEDKITDEEINNYLDDFQVSKSEKVTKKRDESHRHLSLHNFSNLKRIFGNSVYFSKSQNCAGLNVDVVPNPILSHVKPYDQAVRASLLNLEWFVDGSWQKMIDTENVKMWRRPLKTNARLYEYKVCGTFNDISAKSFFAVQTDIKYRKKWDNLVVDLEIIDTDCETENETIRWVTQYPTPMRDREYIYQRRIYQDEQGGCSLIVSRAVTNDDAVKGNNCSRGCMRIYDYKSVMFIQSHDSYNETGMNYFLVYYDDPRTSFPNAAVNWMSSAGIPGFMQKVHQATLELESRGELVQPVYSESHQKKQISVAVAEPVPAATPAVAETGGTLAQICSMLGTLLRVGGTSPAPTEMELDKSQ